MALHEESVGKTNEWYTPPHVFEAFGTHFDMDVASPGGAVTPWIPTETWITADSLETAWRGFIWMNPPFGGRNGLLPWLRRFVVHGDGIALVPDRTSAPWWQWFAPRTGLLLHVAPKLKFIDVNGEAQRSPPQGTTLCAIGPRGIAALVRAAPKLGTLSIPIAPASASSCAADLEPRCPARPPAP